MYQSLVYELLHISTATLDVWRSAKIVTQPGDTQSALWQSQDSRAGDTYVKLDARSIFDIQLWNAEHDITPSESHIQHSAYLSVYLIVKRWLQLLNVRFNI